MALNVDGLISGIDTETIIKGMMDIQKKQVDQITARKTIVETKKAAYSALQAQLIAMRSKAAAISKSQGSPFDSRTVTVSKPDAMVVTAGAAAATGVYQVTVESLAKAHQVATQGFSDADAAVTEGTFEIRVGNRQGATITVDSSNNTLQGLADSINFAKVGVSATVINDGTSGGTPYRLLLTSQATGESGEITVTNNLGPSAGNAVLPNLDFNNPVQAAANARVKLGTGTGAIVVESETNQVSNLVNDVSLTLLEENAGQTINITVAQDTAKASTAVEEFVTAYNGVLDFIDNLTKYDPATDKAGLLNGDRSINQVRSEMQLLVQGVIPGANPKANRLTSVGISTNDQGRLVVNSAKLQDVINGKVEGVTSRDLRRLFALDGTSTTGNVEFLLGSSRTKDSSSAYNVNITQAAERASVTAGSAMAASTVITSANDTLTLRLDSQEVTVVLSEGTYTRAQLAEELQRAVNTLPDLTGRSLAAGVNGSNQLTLQSSSYGNTSILTVVSGNALASLGLGGGESDIGQDVAGEFIVNGQVEAATGRGRLLSGNATNTNTADLQLRVSLSSAQLGVGNEASVTVTRGITSRLDQLIGKLTDSENGLLENVSGEFDDQLESLQKTLDRQQATFDKQQESLVKQFTALEEALAKLQSTSTALGAQLSGLQNIG